MSKKPPINTAGWCYTEVEEDIVYDYAWTIEKFCKQFTNYRPGKTMYSDQFTVMVHGRQELNTGYFCFDLKKCLKVRQALGT